MSIYNSVCDIENIYNMNRFIDFKFITQNFKAPIMW